MPSMSETSSDEDPSDEDDSSIDFSRESTSSRELAAQAQDKYTSRRGGWFTKRIESEMSNAVMHFLSVPSRDQTGLDLEHDMLVLVCDADTCEVPLREPASSLGESGMASLEDLEEIVKLPVKSFLSVGGDIRFILFHISSGDTLLEMAQAVQFWTSLNKKCYKKFGSDGLVPEVQETSIYAYTVFRKDLRKYFKHFHRNDRLRIAVLYLNRVLDLEALRHGDPDRGLAPSPFSHFTMMPTKTLEEVDIRWGNQLWLGCLPLPGADNVIHESFGPDVALPFVYLRIQIWYGAFAAVCVCVMWACTHDWTFKKMDTEVVPLHFSAAFSTIWASLLQANILRRINVKQLEWGLTGSSTNFVQSALHDAEINIRRSYDLSGKGVAIRQCSKLTLTIFSIGFVLVSFLLYNWIAAILPGHDDNYALAGAALILVQVYQKIARHIATYQGSRTQIQWEHDVLRLVVPMNLLLALLPGLQKFIPTHRLLNRMFTTSALEVICQDASGHLNSSMPGDKNRNHFTECFLNRYAWPFAIEGTGTGVGSLCFRIEKECLPDSCDSCACPNPCEGRLVEYLELVFLSQIFAQICGLWYDILKPRCAIYDEKPEKHNTVHGSQKQSKVEAYSKFPNSFGAAGLVTFQERLICHFTLVACFGIMNPRLFIYYFIVQCFVYNLRKSSLQRFSRLPIPRGSDGGIFDTLMRKASYLALATNIVCILHFDTGELAWQYYVVSLCALKVCIHQVSKFFERASEIEAYGNTVKLTMRRDLQGNQEQPQRLLRTAISRTWTPYG